MQRMAALGHAACSAHPHTVNGRSAVAGKHMGRQHGGRGQAAQDDFQQEYFPDSHIKTNFLCNLGYGDPAKLFPRSPRLEFDEACKLL